MPVNCSNCCLILRAIISFDLKVLFERVRVCMCVWSWPNAKLPPISFEADRVKIARFLNCSTVNAELVEIDWLSRQDCASAGWIPLQLTFSMCHVMVAWVKCSSGRKCVMKTVPMWLAVVMAWNFPWSNATSIKIFCSYSCDGCSQRILCSTRAYPPPSPHTHTLTHATHALMRALKTSSALAGCSE